jgi:hypothetical protein
MPQDLPAPGDEARPRIRGVITTLVVMLIAIMVVRDIFVRRWGSAAPAASDVTQHSR